MDALTHTALDSHIDSGDDCKLNEASDILEFANVSDKATKPVLATPTTTASTTIKFAPAVNPVKGNFNLYAIALKWNDDPGSSLSSVINAARSTARIYKDLSNGYVNFNVIAKQVSVDLDKNRKNLPEAEAQAKKVVDAQKPNNNYSIYAIVNHNAKGFSNGSGNTAHLYGTLTRDFLHEIGHCRPFVLAHSGKYDDTGKLLPYDDGTSFMGRFSSYQLTAPQLYALGWLPQNKVAEHDMDFPATDYNIEILYSKGDTENLKAVYIPNGDQQPLFLSMPKVNGQFMFALHLATGGGKGTQRVAVFGNHAEYNGLAFDKISDNTGSTTVRISPTSAKK